MTAEIDLAVIGGGAAGFFGALACAEAAPSARIVIFERGRALLAKVKVSGGGRCNLTNAQLDPARLAENYPRGAAALRGAFTRFGPRETMEWFQQRGVPVKTEPDGRVFPRSNASQTVIDCFLNEAGRLGVEIRALQPVTALEKRAGGFLLRLAGETISARQVLLAAGGNEAAFALAAQLGHAIVSPAPSLFTFKIRDPRLEGLPGISVEQASLRLQADGQRFEQNGALLITHWGLSGPAVLRLSAWGARALQSAAYRAALTVNWLPAYNSDSLFQHLLALKAVRPQEVAARHPPGGLPLRLWRQLTETAGLRPAQTWGECSRGLLNRLAEECCQGSFAVEGKGEFKEEFVTCGGVSLKEVNFAALESRLAPGLFLAGEVLDIDGVTGGFNFQSAWTTAWIAGRAAAQRLREKPI